ncbi:MAG: TonB family protein [Rikenellaceae bacterium]|nr:TonB family protein [Rikenellaceae bacterium]
MSTPILIFMFKSLVSFAGLTLIYLLLIRRRTTYRIARLFLLAMPLLATICALRTLRVLPAERVGETADTGTLFSGGIVAADHPEDDAWPGPVTAQTLVPANHGEHAQSGATDAKADMAIAGPATAWNWEAILLWVYAGGVGLALCWLSGQALYILYIRRMATRKIVDGTPVYRSGYVKTPFSFGKDIFIDREMDGEKLAVVISHECAHIAHCHYIDKTICGLWTAVMWCNPFMWFVARELCMLHEFEADGDVLRRGIPRKLYVHCLVEEVMGTGPYIVNGFSQTLIKNRLIMIKQGTPIRSGRFRVAVAVPLAVVMAASLTLARAETDPVGAPDPLQDRVALTSRAAVPVTEAAPEDVAVAEPVESVGAEQAGKDAGFVQDEPVPDPVPDDEAVGDAASSLAAASKSEPFLKAEEMPQFQGGTLADFRSWVRRTMAYPPEAQKNNVQGTVVASFIVEKNGSVGHVEVLNSPPDVLAREVVRVIGQSPRWTPGRERGKKVRVKYTIPVDFSLQNDDVSAAADASDKEEPYLQADAMPQFEGGTIRDFATWTMKNVVYPAEAQQNSIEGNVVASFVVEKDGSVGDIEILQSPHESLSREVKRVLALSPRWIPGVQRGEKVRVKYTVPVHFELNNVQPNMEGLRAANAGEATAAGVFVDSRYEYILPKSKTTVLVSDYSPREYRVYGYRILDIECKPDETRVLIAVDMPEDKAAWWLIFGSGIYIRDTQTKDRYMIRRLENDIPLDKVIVVQGCGGQSVAFTAIFPPLKKTVKVIDVIDMPNTKIPLPVAGGGSPSGVVWRNVMLSRFPGGDPTVPGEVIR